jgi:hypothetical protein
LGFAVFLHPRYRRLSFSSFSGLAQFSPLEALIAQMRANIRANA